MRLAKCKLCNRSVFALIEDYSKKIYTVEFFIIKWLGFQLEEETCRSNGLFCDFDLVDAGDSVFLR